MSFGQHLQALGGEAGPSCAELARSACRSPRCAIGSKTAASPPRRRSYGRPRRWGCCRSGWGKGRSAGAGRPAARNRARGRRACRLPARAFPRPAGRPRCRPAWPRARPAAVRPPRPCPSSAGTPRTAGSGQVLNASGSPAPGTSMTGTGQPRSPAPQRAPASLPSAPRRGGAAAAVRAGGRTGVSSPPRAPGQPPPCRTASARDVETARRCSDEQPGRLSTEGPGGPEQLVPEM
jgi:hypothetical protein